MESWKHQNHGDTRVLSTHIGKQFKGVGVTGINAGENQVHRVALHEADRKPVGGGFLDEVTQRPQHRSQESESSRLGADNQDPKLAHGVHSFVSRMIVRNLIAGASSLRELGRVVDLRTLANSEALVPDAIQPTQLSRQVPPWRFLRTPLAVASGPPELDHSVALKKRLCHGRNVVKELVSIRLSSLGLAAGRSCPIANSEPTLAHPRNPHAPGQCSG